MQSTERPMMSTDVLSLKIRKQQGKRKVFLEVLLPSWARAWRAARYQRLTVFALAIAVLGLGRLRKTPWSTEFAPSQRIWQA